MTMAASHTAGYYPSWLVLLPYSYRVARSMIDGWMMMICCAALSRLALSHTERVRRHLVYAVENGARCVTGVSNRSFLSLSRAGE